jgi:hypothetical protein
MRVANVQLLRELAARERRDAAPPHAWQFLDG